MESIFFEKLKIAGTELNKWYNFYMREVTLMKREDQLKKIVRFLSILSSEVEHLNSINLYDINIVAETFYAHFLNLIYDFSLTNLNAVSKNATAIDLVDLSNQVCFQVTSENTASKIKDTIKSYLKNELYLKYPKLNFLFLKDRKISKTTFDTKNLFVFNYDENVLGTKELMKKINTLPDDKIDKIVEYLSSQLSLDGSKKVYYSSEVETIIDLLEYISQEAGLSDDLDTFIDPEFKIDTRFSKYADQIKNTFGDLYSIYGSTAQEIKDKKVNDLAEQIKIKVFLQDLSIRMLTDAKNDPLIALDLLIDFFDDKLSVSKKKYDRSAIKFYLVTETINCNVFPNVVKEYED